MSKPVYGNELDRIVKDLIKIIDNKSLDPIIVQAINYAYVLGKNDGYVAGVKIATGDQQ